ncbi:hypothetical protein BD410DRAFT_260085 [Rickenella mellea]|uniref:F-box domain-containing protein n=1 Tax=Rickenella mellea TaxID=50990 RepID=A0A4Y7Q539_9AGAM|nr:hypothetical protein BD410DRAFT_260085 [Rickenella mellea]
MTGNMSTTIETLSPELLSEIFWHCVHDHPNVMHVPRRAPLMLGRICSRWRAISISTPGLWSTIVIGRHPASISVNNRKDLDAAIVWVNRSGTRPLTFCINELGNPSEGYGSDLRQVLEFVVSQSRRWGKLLVTLPSQFMDMLLVPLMEGNTPNLEDIQSQSILYGDIEGFGSWSFVLSSTPHLKRLKFFGAPINIDFGEQIHRVQTIEIGSQPHGKFSLLDLLQCLLQCPSLIKLGHHIKKSSPAATLQHALPNVIALTNLRYLTLTFSATVDPYLVFDRLYLPSITSLRLSMSQCTQTDWPYLASMLKRSPSLLAVLHLQGVPMTERTLIECLSLTPKLEQLSLDGINCSDITLSALTIDDNENVNSAILCPYLSNVDFGPPCLFSPHAFKAMVFSRWSSDQTSDDITLTPGRPSLPRQWFELVVMGRRISGPRVRLDHGPCGNIAAGGV